jgi:thioredoxin 1
MSSHIIEVNDDNFETEVLKAQLPVLVDYWATWCAPCRIIAPHLDIIAEKYQGRLIVAKLNIDDSPNTARRYGVRGIPTLMLFINGDLEATKVGTLSISQLVAFIDSTL